MARRLLVHAEAVVQRRPMLVEAAAHDRLVAAEAVLRRLTLEGVEEGLQLLVEGEGEVVRLFPQSALRRHMLFFLPSG